MIVVPAGVKVHLALGHTDMRKGLDGLATLIQEHPKKDPFLCVGRDYVAEPSWCQPRPAGPDFSAT
ncbi:IS66 family insertion sequence element accessory protein TnpB [Mesorhizobium sp. M1348]|uniref:IS66 family insertion sequence element accessory protein TnpB n=1 Tax=Mesorhizobium sp. M1348 TaxID=2957089 RepID=UPI003337174A